MCSPMWNGFLHWSRIRSCERPLSGGGEMSYTGVIKNVDAEYVLFNALGIPARALVSLTLEGI